MPSARYDGHADWYDSTFRYLGDDTGAAGLLSRLLEPADTDGAPCLDVGCGTGLLFAAVRARGYSVIGVDISADQLRVAGSRSGPVVQADARDLPMRDASVSAVVMTFIHTDVDDFSLVVGQAARALRPGGQLVYLGPHPAFVNAYTDRADEVALREVRMTAGYGDERLHRDPSGRFAVRSRVGARYLTLASFLDSFAVHGRLRVSAIAEFDTAMRPWRFPSSDGRVVPWNIAVTARSAL